MTETKKTTQETKDIKAQINLAYKNGNLKESIRLCIEALENDPTNGDLRLKLGNLYMERHLDITYPRNYLDEAITEYQRAFESEVNIALLHYKMGLAFYYKGNFDKAVSHFNISLENNSKMSESYYMLAKIYYKKERNAEAISYLRKSVEASPLNQAKAYFLLSKMNLSFGLLSIISSIFYALMFWTTIAFDKEGLKEIKRQFIYFKMLPVFIKGKYYEKYQEIDQSIDIYYKQLEKTPKVPILYVLAGESYRTAGKISEAIGEYKAALEIDKVNIFALKALCYIYEEIGDYDNAIKIYRNLIIINPNNAIYYSNLANIFYLKGEIKPAIANYHAAITLNPNKKWTSVVSQTLGFILQESKENYDAAIVAYQNAFLLNPEDIDIYINLASAFYDKGDYNNALNVYRIALEISPDNARIHCNLGYLLWGKGFIEESIKEYETAIRLDSNYDIAYNNLGVIYLDDLGYIQKSIEYFELAIKNNPNYALAYYNKGRAAALKGNKILAAKMFQTSLDLNSYTNELDSNEVKSRINDLFD